MKYLSFISKSPPPLALRKAGNEVSVEILWRNGYNVSLRRTDPGEMGERQEWRMNFEPIGIVKSAATEPVDQNWGDLVSEIHLTEPLTPGLRGLEQFSHLIVLFCMHQATFDPATDLVRRPRGRHDMPELGIFAQRAKHRPNPIGITAVERIAITGNVLKIKGLDAIDGTPVLDLKPYVPIFDRIDGAVIPAWMKRLMEGYF